MPNPVGMRLRHLGLPVRDFERSLRFYTAYFGFDPATAQTYPDGTTIVRNAERLNLALHPAPDAVAAEGFLHFGFFMADASSAHALRKRLEHDDVPVVERDDEPDLVSFKCLDPDGWRGRGLLGGLITRPGRHAPAASPARYRPRALGRPAPAR
jgi:catechol 2,3-dioxygenase-like lactoylglutathione lyase family enzyme